MPSCRLIAYRSSSLVGYCMIMVVCFINTHMWEMEWFLRFVVHAVWRRRKVVYYAVSVISIAWNLLVLVGPSVQTSILSRRRVALPAVLHMHVWFLQTAAATIGLPQMALQVASAVGALQTRAWSALPQVAELVLQRSVLYILLNLIVVSIVVKSGVLVGWASSQAASSMKQDELLTASNLHIVCGSHWLAPNYLQTIYGTLLNVADLSTSQSMLLQHSHGRGSPAHHTHGRGSPASMDASTPLKQAQGHMRVHYLHDDPLTQGALALTAARAAPSLAPAAPAPPSLFTIEPLVELVQSMQPPQVPIIEAHTTRHALRKVATKVDLVQAVRARRRTESRLKADHSTHQQKSGKSGQQVKEKHGIRRRERMGQPIKQGKGGENGGGMEGEGIHSSEDDNELSRQKFNERVDIFISKFKRNLTMQRKDSLNKLLGLC